ncbi:MAG: ABC transporter permease [Candidatus Saganbacteria bacterium]|nr:ABC transporter permease [Candidatus Saganbacteria bacterium]
MPLIELKDIAKTYIIGDGLPVHALNKVSLTIEPGEFLAIMGPSGSGKSTLLAILGLLDKADSGEYKLLDKEISRLTDNEYARLRNHFFGFVFQMFNLLPRLNVTENAALPFIYSAEAGTADRARVVSTLRQIGLGDRLNHRPNQLSGGQQQRVAVARALANKPLVILADEPTGNLDSRSAGEIIGILKELNRQGNTIIMVTHEPDLAQAATRQLLLSDGRIVSDTRKETRPVVELPAARLQQAQHRRSLTLSGVGNYIFEAGVTLLSNKLRSFLSILGVLIGVAAVIAMLAIGTGAKRSVEKTMSSMGSNLLMVSASFRQQGVSLGASASPTRFTFEDLAALKRLEGVSRVAPNVSGRAQVVAQNRNWNTSIVGTSTDYQFVRNSVPVTGRFFTEEENNARAKVAVLGKTVVDELFGGASPLGQSVRINRISFTVVGVLPEKGSSGPQNNDDQIIVPVKTAMYRLLGEDYIRRFDVQVADAAALPAVQAAIVPVIGKLHRMTDSQMENISVRNMAEIQAAITEMASTFTILLGSIAAVSLLVGGIGIMNIMLVMVIERTREIGLRKALGAENFDIMLQFLIEATLICVLGGLLGIALGSLISVAISVFAGWNVLISTGSIVLALTFSILTGIIFGLWPALRAARLLPIIALRYE